MTQFLYSMQIEWNDDYLLGQEEIDNEHQMLFRIIGRLNRMREDKNRAAWACRESVRFFENHALQHFATEEQFMEETNYPHRAYHKELHDSFRNVTLPALSEELERTDYAQESIDHYLGVSVGWLVSHTVTEDLAMVGKGSTTARIAKTGRELQSLEKMFLDYMHDMFDMHGKVVSRHYGGERFGDGVYLRFVYQVDGTENKEEVYFVFNESTLVHSVGLVLGNDTFDSGMLHATRYMARQLVDFMHQHGGFAHKYKLIEESLLTYNDYRDALVGQTPQVGLLFDSGKGYVAFSIVAPHPVQMQFGEHLEADTEHQKVEKYLTARASQGPRQKLLIVDDSATVREGMRELLRNDYEVSLAQSGASAIRAMTLNAPDLVLLDYDMPVMDGRQVLQAMRAEQEFAKTPVVFLTGASETNTVRKLLEMKPFGMLLKSMPQQELKTKIDALATKALGTVRA